MPSEFSHEECKRAVEEYARLCPPPGAREEVALLHAARIGLRLMEPGAREALALTVCSGKGPAWMVSRECYDAADAILSLLTGETDHG